MLAHRRSLLVPAGVVVVLSTLVCSICILVASGLGTSGKARVIAGLGLERVRTVFSRRTVAAYLAGLDAGGISLAHLRFVWHDRNCVCC